MMTLPGGGGVEDISVGETSSLTSGAATSSGQESVVVSSATGLFVSHDRGANWMQAGVAPLTYTADRGRHWLTCSGPCPFPAANACSSNGTVGAGLCLPVAGVGVDYNETRPNTRAVSVVRGLIFATIFDVKSYPTTSHTCNKSWYSSKGSTYSKSSSVSN